MFNIDSCYLNLISNFAAIQRFSEDMLTSNLKALLNYHQDEKTKYLQDDLLERVQYWPYFIPKFECCTLRHEAFL